VIGDEPVGISGALRRSLVLLTGEFPDSGGRVLFAVVAIGFAACAIYLVRVRRSRVWFVLAAILLAPLALAVAFLIGGGAR